MRTGCHGIANCNWTVEGNEKGTAIDVHHAILATLMDIREELRAVSSRLDCWETLSMPGLLRRIAKNTTKPKKRRHA